MDKVKWQDKSVFVTGASGFLGGWLVKRLLELDADVVCLMRDWIPQSNLFSVMGKVKIVRGSIRDQSLLERILGEYEVNTVFHLAAQSIVSVANRNPVSTFDSDIKGTWSLLEACRRSPTVKFMVVASSDKAYGTQEKLPYTEDMPLQGRHPYDVSKSCVDLIAQSYIATYKMPIGITRCGNLYGGGDLNWNRIVPETIRSIIRNQQPIIRSDGTMIRDYFYVEDAVNAIILLAESNISGAFNFSNGEPLSVINMVNRILLNMNSELKPIIKNEVSNEIKAQYLDSTKAMSLLNWKPQYTVKDGLAKTIEWYKGYFNVAE
jgi:CDP-glucose 4,6-dehydratase